MGAACNGNDGEERIRDALPEGEQTSRSFPRPVDQD